MPAYHEHRFDILEDDPIVICLHGNSVGVSNGDVWIDGFEIRFRPVHLPQLQELITDLKILEKTQHNTKKTAMDNNKVATELRRPQSWRS